ncbi:MAG: hypothetical protein U9N79_06465 [Actinomycetota bacterium]|nr:hypothetical protein [Actinomycetota bacterium]
MTDQLEIRLEQTLEAQAASLPSLAEEALPVRPLAQSRPNRSVVSGPAAAFLAAAAVLLVLGGSAWLLGRAPSSVEPAAPDGSYYLSGLPVEWSLSDFAPEGWSLGPVAIAEKGAVLVGRSAEAAHASRGWFSGVPTEDWVEIDAFDGGTVIRGITGGTFGFLASGIRLDGTGVTETTLGDGPRPPGPVSTVWYSPDGTAWTETALPLPPVADRISEITDYYVRPVAGTDRVMVIAGDETDESGAETSYDGMVIPSRPLVWWSEDGSTWELVDEPAWDDATSVGSLAVSDDLIALVISYGGDEPRSVVWTTEDGRNWELAHEFEQGVRCSLAGAPAGFVGACRDGSIRFSADGSTWVTSYTPPEGLLVGHIAGGDGGYVMLLMPADVDAVEDDLSEVEPLFYASADGYRWEPISEPGSFGLGFLPDHLAASDREVIVVGNRYGEGGLLDQIGSEESEMWVGLPHG